MKQILVTGGCGFVGSHLVKYLLDMGHRVWVVDDYSTGRRQNEDPRATYWRMNTQDLLKSPHTMPQFELIFHLAEYSRIVPSFDQVNTVWETNALGTQRVLELGRRLGAKVVYAGSSTRFAAEGRDHSPYALSKAQSADLVQAYGKWFGLRWAICYFYNVYGPGADTSPVPGYESVLTVFERQWRAGQPLTVCGNGQQTRSFTHVQDVVEGLWAAASAHDGEFQLSPEDQHSILSIALRFSPNVLFLPERPGDRAQSTGDSGRARMTLGWRPKHNVLDWIEHVKSIRDPGTQSTD